MAFTFWALALVTHQWLPLLDSSSMLNLTACPPGGFTRIHFRANLRSLSSLIWILKFICSTGRFRYTGTVKNAGGAPMHSSRALLDNLIRGTEGLACLLEVLDNKTLLTE